MRADTARFPALLVVVLVWSAGCWRAIDPPEPRARPQQAPETWLVPSTVREDPLRVVLSPGQQANETRLACHPDVFTPNVWERNLGEAGFDVQVGSHVFGEPGWKATFALRFRRPPVVGDLVVRPAGRDGCANLTFRVQRMISKPLPWKSEFELAGFLEALRSDDPGQPALFEASWDYPPGYP